MRISDWSSDVCSSDLGFLAAVDTDNHRLDLLAGLDAVGPLFVTVAAKIATLDEASCTVFTGLDFKAAIPDFKNRDGNGRALVKAAGRRNNAFTRSTLLQLLHDPRNARHPYNHDNQ